MPIMWTSSLIGESLSSPNELDGWHFQQTMEQSSMRPSVNGGYRLPSHPPLGR